MTDDFSFKIIDEASGLEAALGVAMRRHKMVKGFRIDEEGPKKLSLWWYFDDENVVTEFPAPMNLEMTKAMILAWLADNKPQHDYDPDVHYGTGFRMTGGSGRKILDVSPYSVEYHK